jgi:hypothetical protein
MRNKKLAQLCKYLESGTFIVVLLAVGSRSDHGFGTRQERRDHF